LRAARNALGEFVPIGLGEIVSRGFCLSLLHLYQSKNPSTPFTALERGGEPNGPGSIEGLEQHMSARTGASIQIDALHLRAICDEIGDRLREILRRETSHVLPPRLNDLMQQLAKADLELAPSIVPSLEDIIVECEVMPRDEMNPLAMPEQEPA
jgi:hypothetical protein